MVNVDNIDKFGHCVICHKNLLVKRVVDGKIMDMFLPIFDQTSFLLDTGSQMQVTICKPCKETNDLKDPQVQSNIMAACMKGWELESNMLVADETKPEWTAEVGAKYLNDMSKLSINCNSDNLDRYTLQEKVISLRNMKVEELPVSEVSIGINKRT